MESPCRMFLSHWLVPSLLILFEHTPSEKCCLHCRLNSASSLLCFSGRMGSRDRERELHGTASHPPALPNRPVRRSRWLPVPLRNSEGWCSAQLELHIEDVHRHNWSSVCVRAQTLSRGRPLAEDYRPLHRILCNRKLWLFTTVLNVELNQPPPVTHLTF